MGNLSQQAGKTLYSWIAVEKRFRPGEKLPNEVELSAQLGVSRATRTDRAFHAAIVRAAHNEFMMRLLPMIDRAVETAIAAGAHKEALAQITLQDHALLLEFIRKRDGEGAEHAMAIHMRHAVEELGVEDA